jgi:hypothetical protein
MPPSRDLNGVEMIAFGGESPISYPPQPHYGWRAMTGHRTGRANATPGLDDIKLICRVDNRAAGGRLRITDPPRSIAT